MLWDGAKTAETAQAAHSPHPWRRTSTLMRLHATAHCAPVVADYDAGRLGQHNACGSTPHRTAALTHNAPIVADHDAMLLGQCILEAARVPPVGDLAQHKVGVGGAGLPRCV